MRGPAAAEAAAAAAAARALTANELAAARAQLEAAAAASGGGGDAAAAAVAAAAAREEKTARQLADLHTAHAKLQARAADLETAVGARVGNAVASASVGHHSPGDVFGKQRSVLPLTAADAARGGGGGKPCGRLGLRGALLAVYMSAVHVLLFVAMQSHAQHHD